MFEDIYKINKELDIIFMSKYEDEKRMYDKNVIELIVELSEFANETKCFKYWSVKKMDKEKALEEYADCITMALSFFTICNVNLEVIEHTNTTDILNLFNELYSDSTKLYYNKDEYLVKKIFSNIIYLGKLLNFTDLEISNACYKKMNIIKERLESNY